MGLIVFDETYKFYDFLQCFCMCLGAGLVIIKLIGSDIEGVIWRLEGAGRELGGWKVLTENSEAGKCHKTCLGAPLPLE